MSKLKLSEAAADILQKSVSSGHKDEFGPGFKPSVKTPGQSNPIDLGSAGKSSDDDNYDFTKGVPSATPPGTKPEVGSEPMKKLKSQPQETDGRKDLSPEEETESSDEEIRDRKGKKVKQTMSANPKAITCAEDSIEDIEAMLSGENLSEEFKQKASMIFEAAVNARVEEYAKSLEEKYIQESLEVMEDYKDELSDKLDSYLDYVVENWMEENKLAIETGLKTQIAEDFIDSLRNVFMEHYIDIPEEKVNIVEELVSKVEDLEDQVNNEILRNIELKKSISEHKKQEVINSICEGLTLSQAEKVRSIAKSIEFTSDEDFKQKLSDVKESYYPNVIKPTSSSLNEEIEIPEQTEVVSDPFIAAYVSKISKLTKF